MRAHKQKLPSLWGKVSIVIKFEGSQGLLRACIANTLRIKQQITFKIVTNVNKSVCTFLQNGWLPIHLAAMRGRNDVESVIDLLVKEGADVNACGSADGSTPLHLAVRYTELIRAETIILKLLQHKADPDLRDRVR